MPRKILLFSLGGIVIFSFIPVLPLIFHLYPLLGFSQTINSVLFTFEIGKSWLSIIAVSLLFVPFLAIYKNQKKIHNICGILYTLLLIGALAWSSHASSLDPAKGFISDTTHITAISVWVGTLLIVSWFSKNELNWLSFLKWFTPLAITCLVIVTFSGILLMTFVVDFENYYNSWILPYGQLLLIKHILIIPLIVYAVINGIFIRRKIENNSNFNPKPWARTESLVLLFIFTVTAALSQQSPPKETTITPETVSKIFNVFFQGKVEAGMHLQLDINLISVLFILLTFLFLFILVGSFFKKKHPLLSFVMGILSVISIYISLMFSVA
ncbi:CopD family protein [Niallia taxi]|nr:CopD family protein [Niallia taxi]MDE5055147.1 CopD family protein [Niallia taxi]